MEVFLSHLLAISFEEEENLTGETARDFWMRLATAGAPRDDEQGGEDDGDHQDGGGEDAAEGEKRGSKEDD